MSLTVTQHTRVQNEYLSTMGCACTASAPSSFSTYWQAASLKTQITLGKGLKKVLIKMWRTKRTKLSYHNTPFSQKVCIVWQQRCWDNNRARVSGSNNFFRQKPPLYAITEKNITLWHHLPKNMHAFRTVNPREWLVNGLSGSIG